MGVSCVVRRRNSNSFAFSHVHLDLKINLKKSRKEKRISFRHTFELIIILLLHKKKYFLIKNSWHLVLEQIFPLPAVANT